MKTINRTLMLYSAALVIMLTIGTGIVVRVNTGSMKEYSLSALRSQRMTGYDESIRFQVQNVITLLSALHARETSGELTRAQAQTEAKALVKALRYGD